MIFAILHPWNHWTFFIPSHCTSLSGCLNCDGNSVMRYCQVVSCNNLQNCICAFSVGACHGTPIPLWPLPSGFHRAKAFSADRRICATDNMVLNIDVSGIKVSVRTALVWFPREEVSCRTGKSMARTKGQEQLLKLSVGTVLRRQRTWQQHGCQDQCAGNACSVHNCLYLCLLLVFREDLPEGKRTCPLLYILVAKNGSNLTKKIKKMRIIFQMHGF